MLIRYFYFYFFILFLFIKLLFQAFEESINEIAKKIDKKFYDLNKENEGIKCSGINPSQILSLDLQPSNLDVKKKKKCC